MYVYTGIHVSLYDMHTWSHIRIQHPNVYRIAHKFGLSSHQVALGRRIAKSLLITRSNSRPRLTMIETPYSYYPSLKRPRPWIKTTLRHEVPCHRLDMESTQSCSASEFMWAMQTGQVHAHQPPGRALRTRKGLDVRPQEGSEGCQDKHLKQFPPHTCCSQVFFTQAVAFESPSSEHLL